MHASHARPPAAPRVPCVASPRDSFSSLVDKCQEQQLANHSPACYSLQPQPPPLIFDSFSSLAAEICLDQQPANQSATPEKPTLSFADEHATLAQLANDNAAILQQLANGDATPQQLANEEATPDQPTLSLVARWNSTSSMYSLKPPDTSPPPEVETSAYCLPRY